MPDYPSNDKTEVAFKEVARWKAEKKKGKITLHFDGSGEVKAVEVSQFVK
jgi:hypothetical protein